MHWSSNYVGIPYSELGRDPTGFDCWGLVMSVYANELNTVLPSYTDNLDRFERAEIEALVDAATGSLLWRCLKRVELVEPFDVVTFRCGRYRSHVGVAISNRAMLHVEEGKTAHLCRFDREPWVSRMTGAFRWQNLKVPAEATP